MGLKETYLAYNPEDDPTGSIGMSIADAVMREHGLAKAREWEAERSMQRGLRAELIFEARDQSQSEAGNREARLSDQYVTLLKQTEDQGIDYEVSLRDIARKQELFDRIYGTDNRSTHPLTMGRLFRDKIAEARKYLEENGSSDLR